MLHWILYAMREIEQIIKRERKNTNRNTTYMYARKFRFFCSGKSKICARGVSAAVAKDILSIEIFLQVLSFLIYGIETVLGKVRLVVGLFFFGAIK